VTLDHFMGWGDGEWGTILRTAPAPRSTTPPSGRRQPEPGLSRTTRTPEWMADAACRGASPKGFHPGPHSAREQAEAKEICAGCPVREECLDYALSRPEPYGIWGGLNERERKRLKRRHRAA